jgi:hypothetical protein
MSKPPEFDHNLFNGINPILQSRLQRRGGWSMFHSQHIVEIARALNRILPPEYYATTDDPLRIRKTRTEPDDLVLQRSTSLAPHSKRPLAPQPPHTSAAKSYTDVLEVAEDAYQQAVVLYKRTDEGDVPVTRFEVISPTNVSALGSGALADEGIIDYNRKQAETLSAGINLVEVHYLDRYPPTARLAPFVPNYAVDDPNDRATTATAYHVAVTKPLGVIERPEVDPLPNAPDTYQLPVDVTIYPFGIEMPIPTIAVPLSPGDTPVHLDLQKVYDEQFYDQRWGIGVNYQLSLAEVGMEQHSSADKWAFLAREVTVLNGLAAHGFDLDALDDGTKLDLIRDEDQLQTALERLEQAMQGFRPDWFSFPKPPSDNTPTGPAPNRDR